MIITPSFEVKLKGNFSSSPLKVHQIFKGKSPFVIEQIVDVESSKLNSSSPKVKGVITGRT